MFSSFVTPAQWFEAFRCNPKAVRKSIKAVCYTKRANILAEQCGAPAARLIGASWTCKDCGKVCSSRRALASHAFGQHGVKSAARDYVDGTATCYYCMLQFSSRRRCTDHLGDKSPVCMWWLMHNHTPLTSEELEGVDESMGETERQDGGWCTRSGTRSSVRLEGPSPEIDLDSLPLSYSLDWDSACRHPLGKKNIAFRSPVDLPYDTQGYAVYHKGESSCPGSFYKDCDVHCCLCRGMQPL